MALLHQAIYFAAKAHDGQKRKGTDLPYIAHPYEVAMLLMEAGEGEEVVTAGLLHDTLEDTDATPEELRAEFGPRVESLVLACSEKKGLPWEERKSQMLASVGSSPRDVMMIVCADKLSNIRSIVDDYQNEDFWKRFHRGKDKQAWYYQEMLKRLLPLQGSPLYQELSTLVRDVFGDNTTQNS